MRQRQNWSRPGERARAEALAASQATLHRAVEALNAGRLDEAERSARSVLETRPQDAGALNVLGCVALNRHQPAEAIGYFERARAIQSKDPLLHFNLGEAHRRVGNPDAALRHFKKAARLRPDFAEAHGQAGEMLRALGQAAEAAQAYQAALTLKPDLPHCLTGFGLLLVQEGDFQQAAVFFEGALRAIPAGMAEARASNWANLGSARIEMGEVPSGLEALAQAVACAPNDVRYRGLLTRSLLNVNAVPDSQCFRDTLIELLGRYDTDPRLLATAAVAVLRQNLVLNALLSALASDPKGADVLIEQNGDITGTLLRDDLFLALLSATPIPNVGIELFLTWVRRKLLEGISQPVTDGQPKDLAFICALARQCFCNEYVYQTGPQEESALAVLCADLEISSCVGSNIWRRIALAACYLPLHHTNVPYLDLAAAPALVRILVREQIEEPAQERALAANIVPLRPVRDGISLAVQSQYEENPYPRWTRCQVGHPRPLREVVRAALPHVRLNELPEAAQPRILIAGCGTGVQTMNVVQSYADASVLAVDLSRSSLAYGMRKLAGYGVTSVRHLQADILDLAELGERFDLIESFGVLHHMREPFSGLRVLSSLLAPDGLLFLGLYSEIARAAVIAGRDFVAECAFMPTVTGVRKGRRAIIEAAASRPELQPLLSPASDFWTLSECRDLVFHVEEHRFTLLEIGAMLQACGLEFLGLQLERPLDRARFSAEKFDPTAIRSVTAWHAFELHHPDTFGDTYRIWAKQAFASR
mgnify:CR=1 FL=1